jgi:peptidyl-tRNA hydrolase, PTH1 family
MNNRRPAPWGPAFDVLRRLTDPRSGDEGQNQPMDSPWLIVGLGNPGPEYELTRHNIGFLVADVLSARMGGRMSVHKKARALANEGRLAGQKAIVIKPLTFMNASGGPTKALATFYKVPVEQIIVIHDELDLPFAHLRIKSGGGDNGHNGLKSIRSAFATGDWPRMRVGIGRPPGQQDAASYVLRPWSTAERKELGVLVERVADAIEELMTSGLAAAQNSFND